MQLYLLLSNQEREGGKERERENPPPVSPPVPALVKIHGIQLSWHQDVALKVGVSIVQLHTRCVFLNRID